MDCFNKPMGWVHDDCPQRPQRDQFKTIQFENCAPIAGNGNQGVNIIFDVESDSIPVTAAGTFENFSNQAINVRFERRNSPPIIILVQPHSSLTFVYDDLIRIGTTGTAPNTDYTGSLKIQVNYTIEVNML